MNDEPAEPRWRYWAFLSYSHRDEAVAKALQRRLETYRLPRRLVGRATPFGPLPARLAPVFRDRDELHAGADLGSRVREALAASRWLVVVCTPEAARSPWVDREIREFKRLHGEQRVLALIAAGEPWASRQPGREAEECFPPALRRALDAHGEARGAELEPLAADLRPQGDGPQRAPLKLLAGMAGVGFDELLQREQQRRLRWLSMVTAGALAGMAVFALLAVLALQARDAARHERAQAEGLIEFMLVDLRKRLDAVGRLDVLDSVGARVLEHYDAQPAERLDAAALGQRARAQHLIGEIHQSGGRLDAALAAYQRAAETTARLLAQAPGDGQRVFDHAQSEFWVGYAARERGDPAEAERALRAYYALAQRLVALGPEKAEWRMEVTYAAQTLAVLMIDRGRPDEALRFLEEARAVLADLVRTRPDLAAPDLATLHGWFARAHEQRVDYVAATQASRTEQALLLQLPDAATSSDVLWRLQVVDSGLARLALLRGEAGAAAVHAIAGVERGETLVRTDPANAVWRAELCIARLWLAEAQLAQGQAEAARQTLEQVRADRGHLPTGAAAKLGWRVTIPGRELALAARAGVPVQQLEAEFPAYLRVVEAAAADGKRLDHVESLFFAQARFAWGRVLQRLGQPDAAREQWLALIAELASAGEPPTDPARLTLLALARAALGERPEAEALAGVVRASAYRHPLYLELEQRLAEGKGPSAGIANTPLTEERSRKNPP